MSENTVCGRARCLVIHRGFVSPRALRLEEQEYKQEKSKKTRKRRIVPGNAAVVVA